MEFKMLGQTGFEVSRLCFGALTVGPLQARMTPVEGGRVIAAALDAGVNFFDTAELYATYAHLREGLAGRWDEVHVCSKSYAPDAAGMRQSVERALRELGVERISLFMLHEVETAAGMRGHAPALEYLVRAKREGLVGAVGVSTHTAEAVRAAALTPEVDVIMPLLNIRGLGVKGGLPAMLEAVQLAGQIGKGLYGMKPLGGGNLRGEARAALRWALGLPELASVAIGMRNVAEVKLNVALWAEIAREQADGAAPALGAAVEATDAAEVAALEAAVAAVPRFLHVEGWCVGCGRCVKACPAGALAVVDGQTRVDREKCLLCGYCGAACPEMALKIV